MAITYFKAEEKCPHYSPVIDTNSIEFKHKMLIEVGQLRYGRRGENNYYATISLWDSDLLELHKREYLSVKGGAYADVISDLYELVFNK